jgi:hypothetical protein
MQFEFVPRYCLAQFAFHRLLYVCCLGQIRLEYAEIVSSAGLRCIERKIRLFQESLGIGAMLRGQGNSDAGPDADPVAVEVEWLFDKPYDPEGERDGTLALVLLVFLDDREFIAAQTSQYIGIAKRRPQPLPDLDKQLIACRMSQRVIDILEFIEVKRQNSKRSAMTPKSLRGVVEFLGEQRAVRKAGQQIMMRKERNPLFIQRPIRDVLVSGKPPPSGMT